MGSLQQMMELKIVCAFMMFLLTTMSKYLRTGSTFLIWLFNSGVSLSHHIYLPFFSINGYVIPAEIDFTIYWYVILREPGRESYAFGFGVPCAACCFYHFSPCFCSNICTTPCTRECTSIDTHACTYPSTPYNIFALLFHKWVCDPVEIGFTIYWYVILREPGRESYMLLGLVFPCAACCFYHFSASCFCSSIYTTPHMHEYTSIDCACACT